LRGVVGLPLCFKGFLCLCAYAIVVGVAGSIVHFSGLSVSLFFIAWTASVLALVYIFWRIGSRNASARFERLFARIFDGHVVSVN